MTATIENTTAPVAAPAAATTTRYKWSEAEKKALIREYDAVRGDARKAVVAKYAEKSGTQPQSIVANVYAFKAAFGKPASGTKATAETSLVAKVQSMVERKAELDELLKPSNLKQLEREHKAITKTLASIG